MKKQIILHTADEQIIATLTENIRQYFKKKEGTLMVQISDEYDDVGFSNDLHWSPEWQRRVFEKILLFLKKNYELHTLQEIAVFIGMDRSDLTNFKNGQVKIGTASINKFINIHNFPEEITKELILLSKSKRRRAEVEAE